MNRAKILSLISAAAMTISLASCSFGESSSYAESAAPSNKNESSVDFNTTTDGSARVKVNGKDFEVGGKKLWLNGVNAPWIKWNDFGGDFSFMEWSEHFKQLHENGVNCARVWISCNGEVGMEIDDDGNFTGATEQHWKDLSELFSIAEANQIYIMATVQSFDHYKDDDNLDDSKEKFGAWRKLVQDSKKTDAYVNNYIIPLVEKFGKSDYFFSVDLCNEPDWIYENKECGKIDWEDLSSYYAKASAAIHEHSDVLVTVGMGMPKYNSQGMQGNKIGNDYLQELISSQEGYKTELAYVDFYSTHWYPWEEGSGMGNPFKQTPEEFRLEYDRPIVIGECPGTPEGVSLTDEYQAAYDLDYDGVLAWKTSGQNDGNGLIDDITPTTKAMWEKYESEVFPNGYKSA
ncbi:cellulase family glycosylhydrolase [Ruminococcus sp. NK3A76]|uniref:cellulase family glycosylhydrolase n=1 Tax=Ruminococcus sp. NK3A76 TaxID=877411 RepID=UPI0004914178|nr:cellulase family glycosylhydrolase [Ruminococcus sp. NK3A76]